MINLYELACVQAFRELSRKLPRVAEYIDGQPIHFSTPFKAMELWSTLISYRPKTVLEIGSGMTTCVFALYAKEHVCKVVSVEESEEYCSKCRDRLGGLAAHVELWRKDVLLDDESTYQFCNVPDPIESIDLLYIDGPANIDGKLRADARNLVGGGTEPGLIMFDYSVPAVRDFSERFSDKYRIEESIVMNEDAWYLSGLRHHTFAWRR